MDTKRDTADLDETDWATVELIEALLMEDPANDLLWDLLNEAA